jgi:hypothetical protein
LTASALEDCLSPISEAQILAIAEEVDMTKLKRQASELFGIDCSALPDVALFFRKMEYMFQERHPVNEDFMNYIECLTTTQNEMLELIYDPRNKYIAMQDDPLDSKDLMHGIPVEFKEIFDEVTHAMQHGGIE